jgi:hypothetical protein
MEAIEHPRTLPVLVAPPEGSVTEDEKALFGRRADELIVREIPLDRLQAQLDALSASVGQMLDSASTQDEGSIRLTQISIQVEVTASGGINLIGTATVGATSAMTLTFSR